MLPAPAQGALGLQCRADDAPTLELLRQMNHRPSAQAVRAERAFLHGLSSGCSAPVAAYAQISQGALQLRGLVASLDGSQVVRVSGEGPLDEPEQLGQRLAQRALDQGARAILENIL
jgi:hydroxymethylbilane synthase